MTIHQFTDFKKVVKNKGAYRRYDKVIFGLLLSSLLSLLSLLTLLSFIVLFLAVRWKCMKCEEEFKKKGKRTYLTEEEFEVFCTFKNLHSNCFTVNKLTICEFDFFKKSSGPCSKCGPKCVANLPPTPPKNVEPLKKLLGFTGGLPMWEKNRNKGVKFFKIQQKCIAIATIIITDSDNEE